MLELLTHDWFPLILVLIPIIVILGSTQEHFKINRETRKERKKNEDTHSMR